MTLDFGKPIALTDVIIPSNNDLASLSIDVWLDGEEIDGQRLVVASDIGHRILVMNNIMPAPLCRFLKVGFKSFFNFKHSAIRLIFRKRKENKWISSMVLYIYETN